MMKRAAKTVSPPLPTLSREALSETGAPTDGRVSYWIVDRQFADVCQELIRILRPLSEVRVIIDRRVQQRSAEWSAYPEAAGLWSVPEEGAEDGGKSEGSLRALDRIPHETNGA